MLKGPTETLREREWLEVEPLRDWAYIQLETDVRHQKMIVPFLLWAYGLFSLATFAIFFFQGFNLGHFSLDVKVLLALVGVTVGEIGGLLLLTIRVVFGTGSGSARRKDA